MPDHLCSVSIISVLLDVNDIRKQQTEDKSFLPSTHLLAVALSKPEHPRDAYVQLLCRVQSYSRDRLPSPRDTQEFHAMTDFQRKPLLSIVAVLDLHEDNLKDDTRIFEFLLEPLSLYLPRGDS